MIVLIAVSVFAMIIAVLLATIRTNFQPWYLLYIAPFAALLFDKSYIKIPFMIISIAAVVYYIPFLFTGNWDVPIPSILNYIMITSIVLSAIIVIVRTSFSKRMR